MRGILIPTGGNPREIDIEPDGNGSVLKSLQAAVNGNIDVFDVDIVALGFDWRTGEDRDLTDAEAAQVTEYFTYESTPGSGFIEDQLMRNGAEQPGAFEFEVRDLDGLAFELSIVGDVLEPDNMNKDGLADLGEEL